MIARTLILLILLCNFTTLCASTSHKKTVLITGGLNGIGREIATTFRDEGWNVWVTSRDPKQREQLNGVNIRKIDLKDQGQIKKLIQEIKTYHTHLDVLINNAASAVIGPTETISAKQARDIMEINVIAPFILIQEAIPLMRHAKNGYIINISSTSGLRALPGLGIYAASKMALEGLSEALAAEVAQWNIKVVLVEPGTVKNDWMQNIILAEHINKFPGYKTFSNKLQTMLKNKAKDVGQEPSEVANLTLEIANNPKPDLRYQTNTTVKALAHEILIDPSGNKMREQTISFSKELFNSQF